MPALLAHCILSVEMAEAPISGAGDLGKRGQSASVYLKRKYG